MINFETSMRLPASHLTLHKLEVLCAVAELESISGAAARLGIAQPVVTAHMHALQAKLGVALTAREGRRIRLTEEGRRAYEWARDVVTRTREYDRSLASSTGGSVSIGASLTIGAYVLPSHLADFRRLEPLIDVRLAVSTPRECVAAVKTGDCDFAFTILDSASNADGLEVKRLWRERMVLVAAPGTACVGSSASNAEIAGLPFVAAERTSARRDVEDAALRDHGVVRRRITLEIGSAEGIKEAVLADAGVAFLFEASVRRELKRGDLLRIDTPGMEIDVPVYLMRRHDRALAKAQRALLAHLETSLAQ